MVEKQPQKFSGAVNVAVCVYVSVRARVKSAALA